MNSSTPAARWRFAGVIVAAGLAYFAMAAASMAFWFQPTNLTSVWLPSGLLLLALLMAPRSKWGFLVAAGMAADAAANMLAGRPAWHALLFSAGDQTLPLVAASLLLNRGEEAPRLRSVREVVAFFVLVVGVAGLASAAVGTALTALIGSRTEPFLIARTWFLADAAGILMLVPVVLTLRGARLSAPWPTVRILEWLVVVAGAAVTTGWIFGGKIESGSIVMRMPYWIYPILIWSAVRLGPPGAAVVSAFISAIAMRGTAMGFGPFQFANSPTGENLLVLQAYLIVGTGTALFLGAAEAERQESASTNDQLRKMLETTPDAVCTITPAGDLMYLNSSARQLFGIGTGESLTDKKIRDYYAPEASEILDREAIPAALRTGTWQGESALRNQKGGEIPVSQVIVAHRAKGEEELYRVHIIARDLSAYKALEQQLLQSQKMEAIGRLAGGIAHDFNNLLTVIIGYADLLNLDASARAEDKSKALEIRRSADRGAALVRSLLAFGRRQMLRPQQLDLNHLVRDTESMLRRLIGSDITMTMELEAGELPVIGDPAQMQQVLVNLVVNARDALPSGGQILIRTSTEDFSQETPASGSTVPAGRYACLRVRDNGCGMDAETLAHIFEPFFTTKPEGKGSGLGLSTVYGTIRQGGGYVRVHSAPAEGATFEILLPEAARTAAS